jgi:uncharacterized membrane protein YgaE (UPF0421/DUF939 family)
MAIAQFLGLDHPIFAFIAAVIVTDLTPSQTRQLGLRRMAATVIGALSGVALSMALPPSAWTVALSVLIAMLLCYLLRAGEGARVAGYICALIVFDHGMEPWLYAYYRFIETALGVGVAWLISYVPKLISIADDIKPAQPR